MISGTTREEPYGSSIRPSSLALNLAKRGSEIFHFGFLHSLSTENLHNLMNRDLLKNSIKKKYRIIYETYRNSPLDVIYTHQLESAKLGCVLSLLMRRPHVYDAHSSIALEAPTYKYSSMTIPKRQLFYERLIVKFAAKIIVPSAELKTFLVRKYRLNPGRIEIVKNGVDRERFFPSPPDFRLREKFGFDDDTFIVAFTNPRLPTFPSNEMALRYFFKAIPLIEKEVTPIKFLILGGGQRPNPPSKNVIYTGYVDDLPSHLNLSDTCIAPFPGQAVCGGTRNKVCEYFACGKPVVSTAEGMRGFDDAIPGEHFFLARNLEDFAQRIIECFKSPGRAQRIGQNARLLSEKYDWKYLSQDLERYLKEVAFS
jgi:glycosyltransferase involved in cell wall biosynthesis